jgi:hypothetical protein
VPDLPVKKISVRAYHLWLLENRRYLMKNGMLEYLRNISYSEFNYKRFKI